MTLLQCVLLLRQRYSIFITAFLKCKITKGYSCTKQLLQFSTSTICNSKIKKCSFVSFMLPSITIHFIVTCKVSFRLHPCRLCQFWLSGDLFYFYSLNNLFLSQFKVSFLSLVFRTKQRVCRHVWGRAICASEEALSLYMRVVSVLFLTSLKVLLMKLVSTFV